MSAFSRFKHLPATRRSYSYFSSRSGGGRYFNSAKPVKSAAVVAPKPGAGPTGNGVQAESGAEGQQEASQTNSGAVVEPTQQNVSASAPGTASPGAAPDGSPSSTHNPANGSPEANGTTAASILSDAFAEFSQNHIPPAQLVSSKDFKMHQFFSLHRPLLLISQPASLFRAVPASHPLLNPAPPSEAEIQKRILRSQSGLGPDALGSVGSGMAAPNVDPDVVEGSIFNDADAEAARQLTRALTMSKAGATIGWETTLRKLGLDVQMDADRVGLQEQFEKEWEDVMMDSTKRKRRKKMKKHKLKKRRRATRSERMRLN